MDISEKFHSSFKKIGLSKIVEVSEAARERDKIFRRETGKPFIHFERGELNFRTPLYVIIDHTIGFFKGLTKYPKAGGEPWFKDTVLEHLKEKGITGLSRKNIICTHGGQGGLQLSFNLFRGRKAGGFAPCWSCMFGNIFPLAEIEFEMVALEEKEGKISFNEGKLEKVLKNADLFYLNSPHNPTGKVFSREEIEIVNTLAKKHEVLVISDEPYSDIIFDGKKHISMLETDNEDTISAFTFSKSFAATGFRIGFSVCRNEKIIQAMTKGDYTQTAGVPTATQYAFAKALSRKDKREKWLNKFVRELEERRNITYDVLKESITKLYKPEGAFYFFPNLNPFVPKGILDKDEYLFEKFLEKGVAIIPGAAFGEDFEGYIRISVSATNKEQIRKGTARICEVVEELKQTT